MAPSTPQAARNRAILLPVGLAALALISPWLALAGIFIAVVTRQLAPAAEVYLQSFEKDRPLWWGLPMAIIVVIFIGRHPFPPDDLLRDMTAWAYHYQYQLAFWGSPRIPRYDQYLGFDHVAGWVYRAFPTAWRQYAPLTFQLPGVVLFIGLLAAMLHRTLPKDEPLHWQWIAVASSLCFYTPIIDRIVESRPEFFFALWVMAAFIAEGAIFWVWLVLGLLLLPGYWLAWAYAPAFLVLPSKSWKFKLGGTVGYGLLTGLVWMWLSHGLWFQSLVGLTHALHDRVYGVTENQGLSVLLQIPAVALILVTFVVAPWDWRKTRLETRLLLLWFCLPWMLRYIDILGPILLLLLAEGWESETTQSWSVSTLRRTRLAGFLLLLALPWQAVAPSPPFFIHIPGVRGKPISTVKVLAPFGYMTYDTLYANPGVRITPAMEPGMTRRRLQYLAQNADTDTCAELQRSGAEYLLENTMTATKSCLKLSRVNGPWTLWKIKIPGRN